MTNLQQPIASPEQIFALINDVFMKVEIRKLSEQRISERKSAFLPIDIQYLDSNSQPVGDRISAITKDVSVGGIGIISTQPDAGPKVIVQFTTLAEDSPAILLEIRHTSQIGPFYQIGGSFCADWTTMELGD